MDKNCFVKGIMAGKMLKTRSVGTPASAASVAPSSAAGYDKASFLAGLAVGMSTQGALRWPALLGVGSTRASSTDEMLVELYILDMLGKLVVPKLPGMTALQKWLKEERFTDPSEYADRRKKFGEEIAWHFYERGFKLSAYNGTDLPLKIKDMTSLGTSDSSHYWKYFPYGSSYGEQQVAPIGDDGSTLGANVRSAFTMPETIPGGLIGDFTVKITCNVLPRGKYRLSCVSAQACTPAPLANADGLWAGIQLQHPYNADPGYTVTKETAGVKYNSYNTIMIRGFPPGNYIEFDTKVNGAEFSFYVCSISSSRSETSQPNSYLGREIKFAPNTRYTASVEYSLELLEIYDPIPEEKASLADVLKAADRSGLYYQSITEEKTLLPMLLIDNDPVTIRDVERTKISGNGDVRPDVKHSAKNYKEDRNNTSLNVQVENDNPEYKRVFKWVEIVDDKWEIHEKLSVVASCYYKFTSEKISSFSAFGLYATEKNNKGASVVNSFALEIRRTTQ
uniref:Uncharacterized protein n=1 Tax=Siphoviridae sp. ctVCm11 TaxID=2826358 RepID=A0A8S5QLB8_9CAUD|nr:MAG TPA: hypothetical protein [Siphoviridae sp. ctVCm11]